MGAEQGPQTAGKHGPHEREMASTLAALAAAAPSSGEHPGYISHLFYFHLSQEVQALAQPEHWTLQVIPFYTQ